MPNIHFNYVFWKKDLFFKLETWLFDQMLSSPCFMRNIFFFYLFSSSHSRLINPYHIPHLSFPPSRKVLPSQGRTGFLTWKPFLTMSVFTTLHCIWMHTDSETCEHPTDSCRLIAVFPFPSKANHSACCFMIVAKH